MADRDVQQLKAKGKELMQIITKSSIDDIADLLEGALHVGSGEYNVNYRLMEKTGNDKVVIRVSRYMKDHVQEIADTLMKDASFPFPYKATLPKAASDAGHLKLNMDPVRIKNTISHVTNMLIEQNISPHFVYMLGEGDAKGFLAYVGVPDPHQDYKRYTNVSLHEAFDVDLYKAMAQQKISPFQLRVVLFQVLHGLMTLQHYLPGFRHNDLKLNNILLKLDGYKDSKTKDSNNENKYQNANKNATRAFREYNVYISETNFAPARIPDAGVFAAISDYDLANAPVSIAYADASLGIPQNATGATLMNYILAKRNNFADKDAREALSNKAMASFDTFHFLKSLFDTITSSQALVNKYQEAFYWLQSFNVFQDPRYAGKRYITEEIQELVPYRVISHGTYLFFDQEIARSVRPVSVYTPKELKYTVHYHGDDEERSTAANGDIVPGNAISYLHPQKPAFYKFTPGVYKKYANHFIEFFRNKKPTFEL